ncbi:hypothetical protein ACHAPJ_012076 [Fusarium lateritium]
MLHFDTHQVMVRLSERHGNQSGLATRFRAVAESQRSSPFHVYLAAFKAMLFALTDADEVALGVADGARGGDDPRILRGVGFFLNLLALRFKRTSDSFSLAMSEARDVSHEALAHSRIPFDVLLSKLGVARTATHSPFFQAFIDYRQGLQETQIWKQSGLQLQMSEDVHTGKTAYDLTVDITDGAADGDAVFMFRAQKSLYDVDATRLLADTYVHFLDVFTADPSTSTVHLPFSQDQLSKAVTIGRGEDLVSDWAETLPHRIGEMAKKYANKTALKDNTCQLTYRDMTNRVEAISEALLVAGVRPGQSVPVYEQAAADWPCSMLAIMRIGAVYVPFDLRNPLPRVTGVVQNCDPAAILVDAQTVETVDQIVQADKISIVNVATVPKHSSSTPVPILAKASSPAAILYTSGSTGDPKCIMVTHAGLRNEIEGNTKTWQLQDEIVLQQSAFTFNNSSDQMYTGLVNGGMVYIVPWHKRGNAIEITKIMHKEKITYTKATPSE